MRWCTIKHPDVLPTGYVTRIDTQNKLVTITCMPLCSRAASGQGIAGIYFTLHSRTASGQGHAGNTALCSGAASRQGCIKYLNLHLR